MSDDLKIGPGGPSPAGPSPVGPNLAPGWSGVAILLLLVALPSYGVFNWFFCRIEIPSEHVAVLIAKTGDDLPSGDIIATKPGQKGIQLATLPPGRHFRNPLFWDWKIRPYITISPDKVGVLTRLYGKDPTDLEQHLLVPLEPEGGVHLKGIVSEILKPGGQYPLNPYAYSVQQLPITVIPAGFVGVVCNQVGSKPKQGNTYLVGEGERGVQKTVLSQGAHYLNPYAKKVYLVDIRSQRLEFAGSVGEDKNGRRKNLSAVNFPSSDGFEIEVRLTLEWSIDREHAPDVFVRIGTGDPKTLLGEVLDKSVIPALRGSARIQGSKYPASDYISGESRTKFQESIYEGLKIACGKQGIVIRSVLVNDIVPPQSIAKPIRDRQVAKEELTRNEIQLNQARAEQSLARQTVLVEQEKARVLAETDSKKRQIQSENEQKVALIEQEQKLVVARAELAAARLEAEAILSRGRADAAVIVAQNQAEAEALRASVAAFASARSFASYTFAQKLAPGMRTVFASPDGPFGDLFKDLLPKGDAGQGGAR